ncbi:MAG TPA: thiamine pyrophosphate-dependent enzyme [Candidatus Sulfotelmatobacter sp.]|nr:thiamine pyrophosphate-dependent enzyme [Candidatus Sulfotelmatobacter sp.]
MPDIIELKHAAPWREIRTTPDDWRGAGAARLLRMLQDMQVIRAFEESVLELAGEQLVHGPAHSSIGMEGGAVGAIAPLNSRDQVNGSHRGHHQFLAKALNHLVPPDHDPRRGLAAPVPAMLQKALAEIMGLAQGYCKGRGGSMHLRWPEAGCLGTNAIVGGGVPMAAGAAWAHKRAGTGQVMVTFFGDGATNIGAVLETMNLAALYDLPLCFFIDNNQYAVATTVTESTRERRLSARGAGFGIPAFRVDGMDPLAVALAMDEAVGMLRAGKGPVIVEAETYRYFHQNGPLPGSAFGYRTKDEETAWRARDPIDRVAREAVALGHVTDDQVARMRLEAQQVMARAVAELTEPDGNRRRIRPSLWPAPSFRDFGVRGDLSEFAGARYEELDSFKGKVVEAKFVDVIADVLHRRMTTDERIFVLGEDIHKLRGGTNGATRGLKDAFPDRILQTPISEEAFSGFGGGVAMDGRYRPIVEFMYADFTWVAADQVFNQIAKARHMFGGDDPVPLVLRTKCAMGTGYGSQHSMDPTGLFALSPGWRIVAPTTPFDYVGLMNSALRCQDPVLVLEHVALYTANGPAPADDLDYFIPLGRARVARAGNGVTILTYLAMVKPVLEAVEALGIDAEVIDLRSLDRAGIDWETIGASIRKTNAVMVVEQGALGTSYGTILGDEIQRRFFDWLDHPIMRVHGGEASPSISKVLETAAIAGRDDVAAALREFAAHRPSARADGATA